MTDTRKTLKIPEGETYELLAEDKEPYETWEGYLRRIYEDAHA
jgi:hypothetical protein